MKPRAALLAAAILALTPGHIARAQQDGAAAVYAAFDSLLGSPEHREIYALPPDRYWRAMAPQTVMLSGGRELALSTPLVRLADDFSKATGIEIRVRAAAKPSLPERLALNSTIVLIVGRADGVRFAAELDVGEEERQRFGDGRWPALFQFRRDDLFGGGARAGAIILADDIPPVAMEAFLGLSLVWALGGASLGEELEILEAPGGLPGLTELGKRVFALMYHSDLAARMPLADVRSRARGILGLPE